jgi:hypothetical protein
MIGLLRKTAALALLAAAFATPAYSQDYFSHAVLVVPEARIDTPWVEVIDTKAKWEAFYQKHAAPGTAVPPIDFNTYRIVAGGLGKINAGGALIAIERAFYLGNQVYISGMQVRPGANCVVAQIVTWPTTAIVIPQSNKEVAVSIGKFTRDC